MKLEIECLERREVMSLVVPAFSSLPGATQSLYLDFDGDFQRRWGDYRNVETPAYSLDSDYANLSLQETAEIQKILSDVAEDFAPFNINVTTVKPKGKNNIQMVIGGDSDWTGSTIGGASFLNAFTNSQPNVGFVFSNNLGNVSKYIADAISHEAGHCFGLLHQSLYSGSTIVQQYRPGPGDGTGPLMGYSYNADRSLWWYGQSANHYLQNDFQTLTDTLGLRADETTRPLVSDMTGVIGTMSDVDTYLLSGDSFSLSLQTYGNLDAKMELYDASNNLVATGSTINITVAYGDYSLKISSTGISAGSTQTSYGFNVGQYKIVGTFTAYVSLFLDEKGKHASRFTPSDKHFGKAESGSN